MALLDKKLKIKVKKCFEDLCIKSEQRNAAEQTVIRLHDSPIKFTYELALLAF